MGPAERKPVILGISGSPRRSNTQALLAASLEAAQECGAETRLISLAGKTIKPCIGCYRCADEDGDDAFFCQKHKGTDDMHAIYGDICDADALLIASPVYFGTVSGQVKVMMDRFMPFFGGFKHGDLLNGKLGGGLAVGIKHHGGQELTIHAIHTFYLHLGMIVVGPKAPHLYCSYGGAGTAPTDEKREVLRDAKAVASARDVGARIAKILVGRAFSSIDPVDEGEAGSMSTTFQGEGALK